MENALFPPLCSLIQAFILRIRSCAVSLLLCPGMSFGENSVPLNLTHLSHQFKVMEMGAKRAGFRVLFPNLGGFCTQSSTTNTGDAAHGMRPKGHAAPRCASCLPDKCPNYRAR